MELISLLKESWGWAGLDPFHILAENEFGNLLIKDVGGKIWRLCPEEASCSVIAETESDLTALMSDDEFRSDWEMKRLVDVATASLGELQSGRKFCLKIPGVLGGAYSIENIGTAPLSELISFSGDLAYQCKDLPDGSQVELKVINLPE